jgi:ATP/maltotriose-dependent transcriptional regulator MalT
MGIADFTAAKRVLADARAVAARLGNRRLEASCQVVELFIRLFGGESGGTGEDMLAAAQQLIGVLEAENANAELATAWRLVVLVHGIAGRYKVCSEAAERSVAHARAAGDERLIAKVSAILSNTALLGPTPVPEAIAQCEQLIAGGQSDRQVEGNTLCVLAQLHAMGGDIALARHLCRKGRAMLRDLERGVNAAATGLDLARVELIGGQPALAEREVRADFDFLSSVGETYYLSSMAALLSWMVREQGRDDEALALSRTAEAVAAEDDLESQALWRLVRAPIVARAGDLADAESLAGTAVELARRTEAVNLQADALAELASVLQLAGRPAEARATAVEAVALYLAKGNQVVAARVRAWADALPAE